MTAFYMFRAIFLTFHGEYRGGEPPEHGAAHDAHARQQPHESPWVMALPLLILAVPADRSPASSNFPSTARGARAPARGRAARGVGGGAAPRRASTGAIAIASTALALAGIGARLRHLPGEGDLGASRCRRCSGPVHTLVERKYYIDELYEGVIVRDGLYDGVARVGAVVRHERRRWRRERRRDRRRAAPATALRWVQTGSVQAYGTVGFAGLVVAVGADARADWRGRTMNGLLDLHRLLPGRRRRPSSLLAVPRESERPGEVAGAASPR